MTSQNTLSAIEAFKLVMDYEKLLRSAQETLKEAESYIPEKEKEYYRNEIELLRSLSEGKNLE